MFFTIYKRTNSPKVVGIFFFLLGICFMIISIVLFIPNINLINNSIRGSGIVIQLVQENGEKGPLYYPKFEYYDVNGSKYEGTSEVKTNSSPYYVGETIDILIDRNDPHKVIIDSFAEKYGEFFIIGGFGTVFLIIGAQSFIRHRNEKIVWEDGYFLDC